MSTTDHGRFCWYDLMSRDAAASRAFYTELLGWRVEPMDMAEGKYEMFFMGERGLGGVVQLDGDELQKMLKDSHADWKSYRDGECLFTESVRLRGGSARRGAVTACRIRFTEERIHRIERIAAELR